MILEYLSRNYLTLMMLIALLIFLLVDKNGSRLPEARYFGICILLVFLITISETIDAYVSGIEFEGLAMDRAEQLRKLRLIASTASYILLPATIMIEVLIMAPNKTFRIISIFPGIINAIIYTTAFFGSGIAFTISSSNIFVRGPLGFSIYFTLEFYVFMLALFSVLYFKWDNAKRSIIVILIVVQSLLTAVLEYFSVLTHMAAPITALCLLEYYFYLSAIYQQEMRQQVMEKELYITKQRMDILRGQIQPHFIFNSLSVIRALVKYDSKKAVECIDSFSEYLRAHVNSLKEDELVSFEEELDNAQAYLDLVQADSERRSIEVIYNLNCTDFMIPPLTLEPIVENAIKHGVGGKGGTIRISTWETEDDIFIRIADNGNPQGGMTDQETKRLGVGLDNTRKRLQMACQGTLDTNLTENGAIVTITIPKTKRETS